MRRVDLGNNIVEIHHGHNTTDRWLVVKKRLDASNISLQAKSGVEVESTEIALAFPLGSKWRQRQAQVAPAKQPVFAFLPLRSYGFRFIVQGDFDVPSSREDVDRDSSWNQWLRNEIHTLFVEAFDIFRSHPEFSGLESLWAYLQFVPLEDEILDFFKPVATQILQRLRAFHCIPVATSATGKKDAIEWKLPSQTVMVQDSLLLEVISPELLQRHLGLHYLHRDAAAMLSPLLARSLGVETITSDHLVQIGRSLASSWGDHAGEDEVVQIAKWLACVYRSMDDFQENSTLISALQAMRVIPLSTGQLVSLDQVTVFMFSDSGHTEKPAGPGKRDALSVLRQDLRVVHGHLMATRDNEVNSQKKDRAVLVSYLVYIKEQRARNDSLVNMDELKSVARVLTNQGLKNPATDTVHFTPAYGISLDLQRQLPGHDWVLLDSQYLPHPASQMDVQTWQDFFTQLGVTTFLAVRRQQVTVRRAEMDNSPWAPLKDMLPATEVSYTIQDFVCEEFQQLVSNNTHESTRLQQMTVLFSLLDMAWESHYSRYISAQLLSGDGKTVLKETIPSSFAIALQSLPWVPGVETTVTKVGDAAKLDEKESLLAPSALYIPDPQIKRLLAHTVPYLAVRPSSSHGTFTRFLSIKSSVEKTVVRDALIDWGKRAADTPKEAATFCSTLSHLKQVYRYLFDYLPPKQVVGRMLGRDEVWWQDTSGLFLKYRPTLLEFRSPLADRYPEGLLTDTLTVYAKIGRDLSTSHPPNTLEFMQQQEQAKKVTEMLQKKKVLATKEQAWVSPDDKPMLADNTEFEKMFADKPGVHFLMEQPQRNTSQVNVEHIRVFLALFNIRQLSEEIVKQEIITMFTPCAPGQQYLRAIMPFIQRYLLNQYPDIHDLHREAGMADTLKNTMFVKVKGLEVRYSLKSIPEVYVIRPEKCVITGSHFYFQEKYVESYLEVNKEVARFFSNGDSDCMKDLRNFLMELQPVLTAGSDRDMSDLLSRNDVGPLPDDVEAWEVPAPKLPDPPKPPPPPPPPPAAFVTQQREGDQESGEERSLKAWPPPAPGEQPRSGETNKKSGEGKPMGASIWPPPKPPPGTQHDRDRDLPSNIRVAHPRPDSPSGSVRSDADSAHPHAGSVHPRGEGGTSEGGQRAQHREGGGSGKDYPQDGRPSGQHASDGGERREGGGASGGGGGAETAVRRQDSVPTGDSRKRKGEDVDSEMSESKRPAQEERMTRDPMEAEGARPHPSQKEAVGGHTTQGQPGAAGNGGYGDVAMATGPDADGEKEAPRKRSGVTGRHGYPPYRPRPDQFQLPVWTEFASETEYEELGRGGDLQIPTSVTLSEASDRTEIGRWGELLVYDYLQKQKEMCSEIYDIIWANDVAESGKPYDFEVVCTTEDEAFSLFIEVKATRSSKKEVFEISSNEVKFASEHGERYHIYRIFSAGNTGQVQLVRLTNVTHRMDTKEVRLLMVI
nr:hypothetical protein BaRGS_029688 [Batillaria attramentaria]